MKKPKRKCKRGMAGYDRGGDALRFATNKLNRGGYNAATIVVYKCKACGKWHSIGK